MATADLLFVSASLAAALVGGEYLYDGYPLH